MQERDGKTNRGERVCMSVCVKSEREKVCGSERERERERRAREL